jgi:RHS repeat-associated protein
VLDAAGRLETVRRDGALVVTYGYDANGNRVSEQPAGAAAITATFDDRDRLVSRGAVDYDFDAAGVLRSRTDTTSDETTHYEYDALGGLTAVELADGRQVDYVLDGLGRRVAKKVDGQLRFGLLYGEAVGPSAQLDADGSVRSRFVYGTRSTVPDYMLRDGHRFRIVSDDLGSPRLVVDVDSGEVAQRLDYDAFGRVVQDTNPGFQPFGFAGGVYDADTGLVRFGARDYDPETGRWTAQDPIDFAAGDSNLYGYVLGDPVNLVDPSGLYVETAIDVGFVVYDITTLALGCGSWDALGLDAAGIFLPGIAGLGHADELYRAARAETRVAEDAFEHGYKYHPRVRARGVEDPRAHNFPYSYDDVILKETPTVQTDGSLLYRKAGSINGEEGIYEIAVNPDTGTIFHRTWKSK